MTKVSAIDAEHFGDSSLSFSFLLLFKTKASPSAEPEGNFILKNPT